MMISRWIGDERAERSGVDNLVTQKDWTWTWIFIVWYKLPFISSYFVLVLAIAKVVVKSIANTLSILLIRTIVITIDNTKNVLPIVLKQYKYCNINNPV